MNRWEEIIYEEVKKEDRRRAENSAVVGRARGEVVRRTKKEPSAAAGVERWNATDGLEARYGSGVTTDQGGDGRTREPGGAISPTVEL